MLGHLTPKAAAAEMAKLRLGSSGTGSEEEIPLGFAEANAPPRLRLDLRNSRVGINMSSSEKKELGGIGGMEDSPTEELPDGPDCEEEDEDQPLGLRYAQPAINRDIEDDDVPLALKHNRNSIMPIPGVSHSDEDDTPLALSTSLANLQHQYHQQQQFQIEQQYHLQQQYNLQRQLQHNHHHTLMQQQQQQQTQFMSYPGQYMGSEIGMSGGGSQGGMMGEGSSSVDKWRRGIT